MDFTKKQTNKQKQKEAQSLEVAMNVFIYTYIYIITSAPRRKKCTKCSWYKEKFVKVQSNITIRQTSGNILIIF